VSKCVMCGEAPKAKKPKVMLAAYGQEAKEVNFFGLPRVGDYINHEPLGIAGLVKSVYHWWSPEGDYRIIVEV
jgi:hypothetical protein